jgi:hypothetical protein
MKKQVIIYSLLIAALLTTVGCRKAERSFMNDGIITGADLRMCACCGGLMITFTDNPQPYGAAFRQIENGQELGITEKDKFPIYVKVDWRTDDANACKPIIITRMIRK